MLFFDKLRAGDFPSGSGGIVIALSEEFTYSGLPATALIQFDVHESTFKQVT